MPRLAHFQLPALMLRVILGREKEKIEAKKNRIGEEKEKAMDNKSLCKTGVLQKPSEAVSELLLPSI